MGHQDQQADVESLQKSARRRGGCLSACLVVSTFALFLSVAALAVCGVMVVRELRAELQKPHQVPDPRTVATLAERRASPTFKMQNFAYVEAISSTLENTTMKWAPVSHGEGQSIGSKLIFISEKNSLSPRQKGTYFIYIEVNLTCTSQCAEGVLRLHVGNKLTCDVELPAHKRSVRKKCWTVRTLGAQELTTHMVVPENGLKDWKLELTGSGLGMFLVD